MPRMRMRSTLPLLALAVALPIALLMVKGHVRYVHGNWDPAAMGDFFSYWGAFQATKLGLNPYDSASLKYVQTFTDFRREGLHRYPNPPWMLLLMAPILILPLTLSASIWMYLSIFLTCLSAVFVWKTQKAQPHTLVPCVAASLYFYPLWETLYWAQVGALVVLGVAGFVWAVRSRRDCWAGAFLVLVSVKPHPHYLFLLAVAGWVFLERRYRVVWSFIGGLTILCVMVWIWSPNIFRDWIESSASSWELVMKIRSNNLAGFVRGLMVDFTGQAPVWPLWFVPAVTAAALVSWLAIQKKLEWGSDLAPILCCSVFTSPYGWMHDQLALSVIQAAAISLAFENSVVSCVTILVCLEWLAYQLLVLCLTFSFNPAFQFFWFPLGILGLWWRSRERLKEKVDLPARTTMGRAP
jgi:hypothetical protein